MTGLKPTEEAVAAAMAAFEAAISTPVLVQCTRCKGDGFHHGFGENGHDPDWCSVCGGGGFDLAPGEDARPMREALAAAWNTRLAPATPSPEPIEAEHQEFRLQNDSEWRAKLDHQKAENERLAGEIREARAEIHQMWEAWAGVSEELKAAESRATALAAEVERLTRERDEAAKTVVYMGAMMTLRFTDENKAFLRRFIDRGWLDALRDDPAEQAAVHIALRKRWLRREENEAHFTAKGRRALTAARRAGEGEAS